MNDDIKREDAIKEANTWSMFGNDNLESRLKRLPSADVVEVRHGKWSHNYIKDGMKYTDWFNLHCSVCGEMQRDAWGKWDYCPYCGAKMDEEEQEHENR